MKQQALVRPNFPKRRKALAIAVSTTAALAGSQSARAELVIEEIVVTATKRSENLQDVPQALQAFTTDDIRKQRFLGIDDYVKKVPSLSFASREPGGLSVVFRGVAVSGVSYGANPSSSVYLDENPITASGRNANPRLIDIQRVEALSGPQGTLFGDASQSGALRIITNKPDTSEASGWIDGMLNAFEEGDTGYDLSGMANIPLIADKLALRLVGFTGKEAGYIDNVGGRSPGRTFTNADIADNDVNSADVSGARANLRWDINQDWSAEFTSLFEKRSADGFGDVNLDVGDLQQLRYEDESLDDEWYQLALTLEGPVAGMDGTLAVSYFNRDFRYEVDATDYEFSLESNSAGYAFYDFGGDPRGHATNREEEDRWSVEARLATPSESTSRWSGIVGVFYNKSQSDTLFESFARDFGDTNFFSYLNYLAYEQNGSFRDPTDNWWVGAYEAEMEQKAVFGEISYELTERISITAGGRWYDVKNEFHLVQGALRAGWPVEGETYINSDESVDSQESGFVPKLNIKWQVDDDHMLYATYSEGFRSGGGNALRSNSVLPRAFDSDFLTNYELGAKTTWLDGALQLNAVAFHMVWEDIQVSVEDPQPQVFSLGIVNFPEAEIDGFELDFVWLPAEGWELSGTGAWLDAELSQTSTQYGVTAVEGSQLPLAPEWKASLGAQYTFPAVLFGGVPYLRLDYSYNGESLNALGGLESIIVSPPPDEQQAYSIIDFSVGLEAEGWSAQFFVDNLGDERAEQFFSNRWGKKRLSINDPRSFGVSVRKNF